MQAPTHILAGVLIQQTAGRIAPAPARYLAVTVGGATSHVLLDRFARLTYHPDKPLPRDGFWVSHYAATLVSAAYLVKKYWQPYKAGIIAAVLPDFDWVLFWGGKVLPRRQGRPSAEPTPMHRLGYRAIEALPLVARLRRLPDWKRVRRSTVLELALCGLLARRVTARCRAAARGL